VATVFGTKESAADVINELYRGNVTYIKEEEVARVRGLIDAATQPSEDLQSKDQSLLQKPDSASPTNLNSEHEVSVVSDNGPVKELVMSNE
jgi:hypothetical protein